MFDTRKCLPGFELRRSNSIPLPPLASPTPPLTKIKTTICCALNVFKDGFKAATVKPGQQ